MKQIKVDCFTYDVIKKIEELEGRNSAELLSQLVKDYVIWDMDKDKSKELMSWLEGIE